MWVDFNRVSATCMVVLLHSSAPLLSRYQVIPLSHWWTGNMFNVISRSGVPLFFMLSGFLLIGKKEALGHVFKKRMHKVLVPFAAWSILFLFWNAYSQCGDEISLNSFLSIVLTPASYHLWFLYAIILLYLYIPALRMLVISIERKYVYFFIVLWMIALALIPFAGQVTVIDLGVSLDLKAASGLIGFLIVACLLVNIRKIWGLMAYLTFILLVLGIVDAFFIQSVEKIVGMMNNIDLKYLSVFTGYLIVGHSLGKMEINKELIVLSIAALLLCIGLTSGGNYLITQENKQFIMKVYSYISINVIILSMSFFILLKALAEKISFFRMRNIAGILEPVSSASLGIYLIHPFFLDLLEKGFLEYRVSALHGNPLYTVPLTAVLCFSLSFAVVFVLQKIPFIKRIVP